MKKHTLLMALLAVSSIDMRSNLVGKPFAKFTEEDLDKIEEGLKANDTSDLEARISELEADLTAAQEENTAVSAAVNSALELNGIELENEEASTADAAALLGTTCKEYGDGKKDHSTAPTDGLDKFESSDGLVDGYYDPKAAHNQLDI